MKNIQKWANRLSKPNKNLGGLSACPWAKSSLKSKRTIVIDSKKYDAIVFIGDIRKGWVFMKSDPKQRTRVAGKKLPSTGVRLTIIQNKKYLDLARKILHKTKYYEKWNADDYRRIVLGEIQ